MLRQKLHILFAAVALAALSLVSTAASARPWHGGYHHGHHGWHHGHHGWRHHGWHHGHRGGWHHRHYR